EHKVDGELGKLNATDELLFMFRDASITRLTKRTSRTILKEITIQFPNEKPRYVYLVKDNAERNQADYVRPSLNEHEGVFESNYIKIRFDKHNISLIKEISLKTGEQAGENIFDSLYFRLSAGFLNKHA